MVLYRPDGYSAQALKALRLPVSVELVLPSFFIQLAGICISLFLATSLFAPSAEAQSGAADYEKIGLKQFSQGSFKDAAESFRLAIYKGAKSASTWLYLGESYDRAGEVGAARQTYQTLQKYFPGTPQCARATERLTKLPQPVRAPSAATAPSAKAAASPAANDIKPLKERIYIVPPRFGHSPVSPGTISLVNTLVRGLPEPVYKILDQGNTNIYLTPNLIDKWPDGVSKMNENLGILFSQEHGRTYGREVYLCERVTTDAGGTSLGPVQTDEILKDYFYIMLSHALNDCLELPSKDPQFVALYKQDYDKLDTSDRKLHAFIAPVEGIHDTFSALTANIMGSSAQSSELASRSFPRCRAWIAQHIKILSVRKP